MIEIEKPHFDTDTADERVIELKMYLDELADELNYLIDVFAAAVRGDGRYEG